MSDSTGHVIGPDGFFRPNTAPRGAPREPAHVRELREAHARESTPVPLGPAGSALLREIELYLRFFAAVRERRLFGTAAGEEEVA
jgi:hypothetical protein